MALREGICASCEKKRDDLVFLNYGDGFVYICKGCIASALDTDLCWGCGSIMDDRCRQCAD